MSRPAGLQRGRPTLEIVEAAVQLLRTAPAGALLAYYIGSMPCLLGLLYFWGDMSGGAFARQYLIEASLGVAVLYLWMKCWQSVFASKLRAHLLMEPEAPWTPRRIARMASVQMAVQPSGLFLRVIAAQLLLPYVWTYGFYQNVGILGDGTDPGFRSVVRAAGKQASLWPRQAHAALLCLLGFALVILLNVGIIMALLPYLLKMFFGVESVFTRGAEAMFNSTFVAAAFAGTYLCFDPIRKAVFVLRCFHGLSLQAGDDLRAGLKEVRQRARPGLLAALMFILVPGILSAAPPAAPSPAARVEAAQLAESLDRVLERREFAWRLPRSETGQATAEKGWLTSFFEGVWKNLVGTVKKVVKWAADMFERLRKAFQREPKPDARTGAGGPIDWPWVARVTLILLIPALAIILGVMLWMRRSKSSAIFSVAQPVAVEPDLTREDVTADQLPEDGWLQLARDLVQRGELRLALRASYLAGLAHLHHRELIRLAKHKSNRDYDRELQRRARSEVDLLDAFGRTLRTFERAWYGEHPVTPEMLGGVSQDLERIRVC